MSDERRVIGYDVGAGGDGGPVYARADGAGEATGTGGPPAGWEWRPIGFVLALVRGDAKEARDHAASVYEDGSFKVWNIGAAGVAILVRVEPSNRRPGETLLAAAQREAVAALWTCDGFGVGEVRSAMCRRSTSSTSEPRRSSRGSRGSGR